MRTARPGLRSAAPARPRSCGEGGGVGNSTCRHRYPMYNLAIVRHSDGSEAPAPRAMNSRSLARTRGFCNSTSSMTSMLARWQAPRSGKGKISRAPARPLPRRLCRRIFGWPAAGSAAAADVVAAAAASIAAAVAHAFPSARCNAAGKTGHGLVHQAVGKAKHGLVVYTESTCRIQNPARPRSSMEPARSTYRVWTCVCTLSYKYTALYARSSRLTLGRPAGNEHSSAQSFLAS